MKKGGLTYFPPPAPPFLIGIGVWFVLDSAVSLAAKNTFNEFAVNVPLLILVALPLWFTRKAFE